MPTVSWEVFLKDSLEFVKFSDKINDGWHFSENIKDEPGSIYLYKSIQVSRPEEEDCFSEFDSVDITPSQIVIWEYHILYSLSYSVPVLYFNVYDSGGKRLSYDCTISSIKCVDKQKHMRTVSQAEHPLLMRPYYFIHPCHTAEFLCDGFKNVIVCWLSVVAPLVNLTLSFDYAKI